MRSWLPTWAEQPRHELIRADLSDVPAAETTTSWVCSGIVRFGKTMALARKVTVRIAMHLPASVEEGK